MDFKPNSKKCEVCLEDATSLCFNCASYYCEDCFKLAHKNEIRKDHKKEKVDLFVPIDIKCPKHNTVPMNLFCLDEKSN